jgi:hypothetical protein
MRVRIDLKRNRRKKNRWEGEDWKNRTEDGLEEERSIV